MLSHLFKGASSDHRIGVIKTVEVGQLEWSGHGELFAKEEEEISICLEGKKKERATIQKR